MKRFEIKCDSVKKEQTLIGSGYRLSVLSPTILRVELSKNNCFEDRPSQMVFRREFCEPEFKSSETASEVKIETSCNVFVFNKNTKKVRVQAKDCDENGAAATHTLSTRGNLHGTVRTIDFRIGAVPLGKGLMSKGGASVVDDTKNFLINPDGSLSRRTEGTKDFYVFAFDRYYADGLVDFYKLTGFPPALPKYAHGNWWSRYYAYSQSEYLALMDKFAEKKVPLSVATVDMDWHWVKEVPKEYGSGWTGYSWNTGLFPDYKEFLKDLKSRGLAVTLNVHPAGGVRAFEDMYADMARAMDVDPATKLPIKFDLSNPKFLDAYFKILHNPYEKDGVDFWWIDWQQGKKSSVKGLDPLWLLNHYHTLDINRGNKKGIILSRYAKLGSHRYPLGFSGDCIVAWKSLKFQPYLTSTATNVGYTWWSHDIGGHVFGRGDDELYLRWLQWGVFSPVNRLHSSKGAFMGKEPWLYRRDVEEIAEEFLRLRHKMLPYLYTANVLTATSGEPLMSPMYYNLTEEDDLKLAYRSKASYFFGSRLVVAPVTAKLRKKFNRAGVKFYLPEGEWTDVFTGQKYAGGKNVKLFRKLDSIPVLAQAGSVIPMLEDGESNSESFENLEVNVYFGYGSYTMYDDNGSAVEFSCAPTENGLIFNAKTLNGNPKVKTLTIVFKDISSAEIAVDGEKCERADKVVLKFTGDNAVELMNIERDERENFFKKAENILQDYHIFTPVRRLYLAEIKRANNRETAAAKVKKMLLRSDVKGALVEALETEE